MQRRVFLTGVAATAVLAACGDDGETSSPTADPPTSTSEVSPASTTAPATTTTLPAEEAPVNAPMTSVELVDHPYFETDLVMPDQALLDELATDYAAGVDDPEIERFLFGTLPVVVFDQIFAEPVDDLPTPSLLWLLHLSGYFGGRWLRGEIAAAQPDAPLVQFSVEPDEAGFAETLAKAALGLDAAAGDDPMVLAYAEASLFPTGDDAEQTVAGLVDSFGYNQGYMLEILASPPDGLTTPDRYQIDCDGLLSCSYTSPRMAALPRFAPTEQRLAGDGAYADLAARMQPIQDAAIPRGRSVWSSGLSVQGFPQVEYDQLLDVSSSFLETVQLTALAMVDASVNEDATLARTGAVANAAMTVWLDAYMVGLLDGTEPIELPVLTTN